MRCIAESVTQSFMSDRFVLGAIAPIDKSTSRKPLKNGSYMYGCTYM